MSSISKYIASTQVASSVPFDNSTNGFISTDTQAAIEEVLTRLSVPSVDQNYYVSKNGSDTTGNGSISSTYLTIGKALTVITDSSPSKRYTIQVGPGDYNENLVLKANVFIAGSDPIATRITGTTLNINDATWTGSGDNRSGFQDISVNPTCTWDFTAQSSQAGKLYFFNVRNAAAWTFTAFNAINQVIIQDSELFGTTTFIGMQSYISATAWQSGNIVVNSSAAASIPASCTIVDGMLLGNITATWTSNSAVTVNLAGLNIGSSTILTASGASCTVNANDGSLPIPANRTFSSSAILVRVNDNYAAGLLSATTNVTTSAATAPTAGQALVATSSTVAAWSSVSSLVSNEITSVSAATTTSGTDALITSMTTTPAAGTYLVLFNSTMKASAAGSTITYSYYLAGSQVAATVRPISPFDGGTLSSLTATGAASLQSIITVNGSQAIEVRWNTSAGTATCNDRSLITLRVA